MQERNSSICSQEVCNLSFSKLFHILSTTSRFLVFSRLSAGEEDGYLHWQYHRRHSEGHGCGIRRFFQLCGSFCLSVHHHPVGQQGFPNSPGSAVQQPCRQVLRYVVCTLKCLGLQSKSFSAQKCCIILREEQRGSPRFSPAVFLWSRCGQMLSAAVSEQLMAGGEEYGVPPFFAFHAHITHSSPCLV